MPIVGGLDIHRKQITGRPPRPVAEFLHTYRAEFR